MDTSKRSVHSSTMADYMEVVKDWELSRLLRRVDVLAKGYKLQVELMTKIVCKIKDYPDSLMLPPHSCPNPRCVHWREYRDTSEHIKRLKYLTRRFASEIKKLEDDTIFFCQSADCLDKCSETTVKLVTSNYADKTFFEPFIQEYKGFLRTIDMFLNVKLIELGDLNQAASQSKVVSRVLGDVKQGVNWISKQVREMINSPDVDVENLPIFMIRLTKASENAIKLANMVANDLELAHIIDQRIQKAEEEDAERRLQQQLHDEAKKAEEERKRAEKIRLGAIFKKRREMEIEKCRKTALERASMKAQMSNRSKGGSIFSPSPKRISTHTTKSIHRTSEPTKQTASSPREKAGGVGAVTGAARAIKRSRPSSEKLSLGAIPKVPRLAQSGASPQTPKTFIQTRSDGRPGFSHIRRVLTKASPQAAIGKSSPETSGRRHTLGHGAVRRSVSPGLSPVNLVRYHVTDSSTISGPKGTIPKTCRYANYTPPNLHSKTIRSKPITPHKHSMPVLGQSTPKSNAVGSRLKRTREEAQGNESRLCGHLSSSPRHLPLEAKARLSPIIKSPGARESAGPLRLIRNAGMPPSDQLGRISKQTARTTPESAVAATKRRLAEWKRLSKSPVTMSHGPKKVRLTGPQFSTTR